MGKLHMHYMFLLFEVIFLRSAVRIKNYGAPTTNILYLLVRYISEESKFLIHATLPPTIFFFFTILSLPLSLSLSMFYTILNNKNVCSTIKQR